MKKIALIQSNYIPWIGYFAIMNSVDLFIIYECVQYTKNDWRNRNQIQSIDGRISWLSIPIRKQSMHQEFMNTTVSNHSWANTHFNKLKHNFTGNKGWLRWHEEVQLLYAQAGKLEYLFEINRIFLNWVIKVIGIRCQIVYLDSYHKFNDPNERLISILQDYGATHYLSGPAAKSYISPSHFYEAAIDLTFVDYDEIIREMFIGSVPELPISILQLILEGKHEFRYN